MIITEEIPFSNFEPWGGAVETYEVIEDWNKEDEFEDYINENYSEGINKTDLNDLLAFDSDFVYEMLGIPTNDGIPLKNGVDEDGEESEDGEEKEDE
jgi:hypothetical protein